VGRFWRSVIRCPCVRERIFRSVLPARYQNSSLEDFPEEFSRHVRNWIGQSPTPSLLLTGPTGTGKTHMAAAIVRLTLEAGRPVLFKRASDFYSAVRESFNQPNVSKEDVMREYGKCPMLVLDDLGSGSLSDHERRCTLELLDMRLDDLRPTVVTTNWTIEQIRERMDERIASRLSDFMVIALVGGDRRGMRGRR
jgi:DNA replication protein DnaC